MCSRKCYIKKNECKQPVKTMALECAAADMFIVHNLIVMHIFVVIFIVQINRASALISCAILWHDRRATSVYP